MNGYDNFNNPVNSANMNPGFGIDANLLTPSFQAQYRPQFTGNSGYSPYGKPSFGQAASNIFGPARDPYFGNPTDNMRASVHSMTTKPFDAAMWGVQNLALPYAGYSGMAKVLGPGTYPGLWNAPAAGTGGMLGGISRGMSDMMGMPGALWRGQGLAAGVGRGVGMGLANSVGMTGRMAGFVGGMGGLAGGVAIPFAAGKFVTDRLQEAFIDPYISNRANSDMIQRNFSNTYMGTGYGSVVSGKGFSYKQSSDMGARLSHMGLNDSLFTREDYTNITDMSARAGLFDNRQGGQITQRVKDIAEQIKLIVSISKDPSIKNAIEELSKLNMGGASLIGGGASRAASAYHNMGSYASQAGVSIQKLMSGVGAQGQYMFQANGMTPYLGQLAAANSYAGFAAAKRAGLLSEESLARMGGLEGATQSSLSGQIRAASSQFSSMNNYNQHFGGGMSNSLTGTVAAFGAAASGNPLTAGGNMGLYGAAMRSAAMAQEGSLGAQSQAIKLLKAMGVPPDNGGKYSVGQINAALTSRSIGLNQEESTAYTAQRASEQSTSGYQQRMQALAGYSGEQTRQWVANNSLGGGSWDTAKRRTERLVRGYGGALAENYADAVSGIAGSMGDAGTWLADKWSYGRTLKDSVNVDDVDSLFSGNDGLKKVKTINVDSMDKYLAKTTSGKVMEIAKFSFANAGAGGENATFTQKDARKVIGVINSLAEQGNKRAIAYINAKIPEERRAALDALLEHDGDALGRAGSKLNSENGMEGVDKGKSLENLKTFDAFASSAMNSGLVETDSKVNKDLQRVIDSAKVSAKGTGEDTSGLTDLQTIGAAVDITSKQSGPDKVSDQKLYEKIMRNEGGKYSGLIAAAGGENADYDSVMAVVASITKNAVKKGSVGLGHDVFKSGLTSSKIAGMDKRDKDKAFSGIIKARGGRLADLAMADSTVDDATSPAMNTYISNVLNGSSQAAQITKAWRDNEINYSEYTDQMKKIDSTAKFNPSSTFALAVDKFATTVDAQARNGVSIWGSKDKSNTVGPDGRQR